MKRTTFLGVSSRRSCRSSENCSTSLVVWGTDLDYCDIEWFALETNRDHSVIFETAPQYCVWDSFVDYEGYSISSKGFLPTVVDTMVSWIKFLIPVHFSSLIPKKLIFTLVTSYLAASSLPWFMVLTFQVLCNAVLYSIGLYFHHQTHPQQGTVSAVARPLPSVWSYLPLFTTVAHGTPTDLGAGAPLKCQCHIFSPFHTVYGVLKARILEWFAIPFSSGPHFVRSLWHHDPSTLGGPTQQGSQLPWVTQYCDSCDHFG